MQVFMDESVTSFGLCLCSFEVIVSETLLLREAVHGLDMGTLSWLNEET